MEKKKKQKPIHNIRVGCVEAAIWENKKGNGYFVTFQKSYTDENGEWETTECYISNDLPKLGIAQEKAYEWILSNRKVA